jgi:hypothetical protein
MRQRAGTRKVDGVGYLRLFRRTKVGPGVTLNLSRSGPSLSVGPRGAKVTVRRRGVRRTVGIPGTGVYYTSTTRAARRRRRASDGAGLGTLLVLVLAVGLVLAYWQVAVVLAIGAAGIFLMWWALRRDRQEPVAPMAPESVLAELDDLHNAGVLSDAEYEAKRAGLAGQTPPA